MNKEYMQDIFTVWKMDPSDPYDSYDELVGVYLSKEIAEDFIKRQAGDGYDYFLSDGYQLDTRKRIG